MFYFRSRASPARAVPVTISERYETHATLTPSPVMQCNSHLHDLYLRMLFLMMPSKPKIKSPRQFYRKQIIDPIHAHKIKATANLYSPVAIRPSSIQFRIYVFAALRTVSYLVVGQQEHVFALREVLGNLC